METNSNALNWFEIPATDINRASKFYSHIFNTQMGDVNEMMGMKMANFPNDMQSHVSGCLAQSEGHKPSAEGAVIYLNANPDLQHVLDRIPEAGGQVVMPKMAISDEIGAMAFFIDSEGNKVGLHSSK